MYVLIVPANTYWTANNTNILIIENWPILCDIFIFKTLLRLIIFWISQIKLPFPFRVRSNKRVVKTDRVKHTKAAANNRDRAIYRRIKQISPPVCVPFHRTSDTRKIFVFAILAKLEPRIGSSTSSVFFFSLSLFLRSLAKCQHRVSTEFRSELEELVEGSRLRKKAKVEARGKRKTGF